MRLIRKATREDIPQQLILAEEAKKTMRRSGNMKQWGKGYPSAEVFALDIDQGNSYMVIDEETGKAVATFAFIPSPEPTYAQIYQGQWLDDEKPYYVIHRIAALSSESGIMGTVLDYCFSQTDNIRIDTHRDNVIMRHLMKKNGFDYCGIIYLANGDERLAFQKVKREE